MKISFNGLSETVASFYASEDVKSGDIVQMSDNFTVGTAEEGTSFVGVCLNVREGIAAVQLKGYAECKYSETAPALGFVFLAAGSDGTVRSAYAGQGRFALVIAVDTQNSTVKFVLL